MLQQKEGIEQYSVFKAKATWGLTLGVVSLPEEATMNLEPVSLGAGLLGFLLCGRKYEALSLICIFSLSGVKPFYICGYCGCLDWVVSLHSKFQITSYKHTFIYLPSVFTQPGTHSKEAEPHAVKSLFFPGCAELRLQIPDRITEVGSTRARSYCWTLTRGF